MDFKTLCPHLCVYTPNCLIPSSYYFIQGFQQIQDFKILQTFFSSATTGPVLKAKRAGGEAASLSWRMPCSRALASSYA